jgi:hypothetical protein
MIFFWSDVSLTFQDIVGWDWFNAAADWGGANSMIFAQGPNLSTIRWLRLAGPLKNSYF